MGRTMSNSNISSDYWRMTKSSNRILEMVEVLRSLHRVVDLHLPGTEIEGKIDVHWSNPSRSFAGFTNGKNAIYLSPSLVLDKNEFPASTEIFDAMVGVTIHEAGHIKVDSYSVGKELGRASTRGRKNKPPPVTANPILVAVATCGEEVMAENAFASRRRSRQYRDRVNKLLLEESRDFKPIDIPLQDACKMFNRILIGGSLDLPMDAITGQILDILLNNLSKLNRKTSVWTRTYIYRNCAKQIETLLRGMVVATSHSSSSFSSGQKKPGKKMVGDGDPDNYDISSLMPQVPLDEETGNMIQQAMLEEAMDVTQYLADICPAGERIQGEHLITTVSIVAQDENLYLDVDEDYAKQLQWLATLKQQKETVIMRGQEVGLIDRRRIHRIVTDGRIFKDEQQKLSKPKEIVLLMDTSGSMLDYLQLFTLCATFHRVTGMKVYSYNQRYYVGEQANVITRLDRGIETIKVHPDGFTPSGEAILYIAGLLHKSGGGMILHFSDGDANGAIALGTAQRLVAQQFPDVHVCHISNGKLRDVPYVEVSSPQEFAGLLKAKLAELWGM